MQFFDESKASEKNASILIFTTKHDRMPIKFLDRLFSLNEATSATLLFFRADYSEKIEEIGKKLLGANLTKKIQNIVSERQKQKNLRKTKNELDEKYLN